MVGRLSLFAAFTKNVASRQCVYADETPKILKLKTIAQKSQIFYSTDRLTHMRMRDMQTTQKKMKKTRMKQRHDEKNSIEMWHE